MKLDLSKVFLVIATIVLGLVQSKIQEIQIKNAVEEYFKE